MQYRNIREELEVTKFKKDIEREIENYFEKRGFSIIEPRILQDYDEFIESRLMENSSKTVKVLGGDSKIYVLRPDITTNILSQIFSKWEGEPPLKVYYNSKIYSNSSRGSIVENYQMGIESLGDKPFKADLEIVEMAISILATLGQAYILEMGSSNFLDGLFRELKLESHDEKELKNLISKKNRDGLLAKMESLKLENPVLKNIFNLQGSLEEVLNMVKSYEINQDMREALASLEYLKDKLIDKNIEDKVKLDLSMIADLDYYDGIIFRGYYLTIPKKILSGGRYDKSTSKYGAKVPAIGFMIDMDLVTRIRIREVR